MSEKHKPTQPAPDVAGLVEALEWLRGAINCTPENDKHQSGAWISTKHPRIRQIDELLAAHRKQGGEPAGAEQQPDVTLLLELLSHARCNTCDGSGGLYDSHGQPHQCQWCHDRSKALAAHRKGGEA